MTEVSRVLIVEASFYPDIADELANGAVAVLAAAGISHDRIEVPGTFEVPAAIRYAVHSMEFHAGPNNYNGFVALGCVIRGETDHYDHICRETSRALMDLTLTYSLAIGFGILTCDTREQAFSRAATDQKNKGADAAQACLRMMEIKNHLHLSHQ
ncbi:MAG: 6,7-dimethyl-8-ribityllumazine synthase [Pseudomonadota bacterium]|nr:6,7-dimethyl-8-ribityllumazine synthase [Pseudomonadota bacterium]